MTTPGWYPDPLGGPGKRYWNGTQWDGATAAPPEDYPIKEARPNERKRTRLLIPGLLVLVGLLTGVLAMVLWPKGEKPQPETAGSPTAAVPSMSPTEAAAADVKASMQHKLDSDSDLSKLGLKVLDVVLVNKSGNEYKGIATVKTEDGEKHDVAIDVTADQNDIIWTAPPGAFLFALPSAPPPPAPKAPPPRPTPPRSAPTPPDVEDITICPSGVSAVASEDTSCAFADNVRASWYSSRGSVVIAYSPVTGQEYRMLCAPAVTTHWPNAQRCSGENSFGATLTVYFS